MKVAICTPIGPGHEACSEEAHQSVLSMRLHPPFESIIHLMEDDTQGALGRSAARNRLCARAAAEGATWLFWLDADDLMVEDALQGLSKALHPSGETKAVWGKIVSVEPGGGVAAVRTPQYTPGNYRHLLQIHPFRSLRMGFWCRVDVAQRFPWDEEMDCGEDFDLFLRLWKEFDGSPFVKKSDAIFMVNRRGNQSKGPRSATGGRWVSVVTDMLHQARLAHR